MAGKKSKGPGSGKKERPPPSPVRPITPVLLAAAIPVIAFAIYSAIYSAPGVGVAKSKEGAGVGATAKEASAQVPIETLEAQMRQIHSGLKGVAGRGDSTMFKKIKDMASIAEDVLSRASAASTEGERRVILEAGLEARSDMLSALMERSDELRKEEAEDRMANEPVSVNPAGHVAQLTKDTFATYMARNSHTMVEFFAPWCGHCKKLAPEYERVAEQLKDRAGFAAVDATEQDMLARVYGISGYPTLKWFFRGHVVGEYSGPRTAAKITEWVEQRLEPAYSELEESTDLDEALHDGSIAICAGAGTKGSNLHAAFEVAAEQFRLKFLFVWSSADSESIVLHRHGQDALQCIDDGGPCAMADKVVAWLEANAATTTSG